MAWWIPLAASFVGSFFDKKSSGSSSAAEQPVKDVIKDLRDSESDDNNTIAFVEGLMAASNQGKQTTKFDPVAALTGGGQAAQPMAQTSNRIGGQSSPGFPGQGLYREPLGPGRGAGGSDAGSEWLQQLRSNMQGAWGQANGGTGSNASTATTPNQQQGDPEVDWWRELVANLQQRGQGAWTGPLRNNFTGYMREALAGNMGLPADAMNRATLSGQRILNAQAAQAREGMTQNLGSRGLLTSGIAARGEQGIQEQRLGGMSDLISGLAQQDMQARVEAQRAAAGMIPGLAQVESGVTNDLVRSWLALQQLELERGRLGLARQEFNAHRNDALWNAIGGAAGAYFGRK